MKKMSKSIALLLALVMVFSVLAACASNEDTKQSEEATVNDQKTGTTSEPAVNFDEGEVQTVTTSEGSFVRKTEEGTLTVGGNIAIASFDPTGASAPYTTLILQPLVRRDPATGEMVGCLAESWEWSDDYLTCTFHLRDAYFTNGEPVTSEDVYYCLNFLANSTSSMSAYFTSVDFESSSCPDEKTFVLQMKEVYSLMEYRLADTYIYSKSWAETATPEDWWSAPVCSGPYVVVEHVDGSHCKMVANENYWGGEQEAHTVTYRYYSESAAEFIAYQTGEIDIAMNILAADAERITAGEVDDTTLKISSAYDFKILALCEYVEALQNENVRKAIAHAIDRQACADAAFGILGTAMDSNLNDSCAFYRSTGTYEYDPELARQLLADAGYEDGDITLRMVIVNTNTDQLLAEAVQAQLADIGITVTIEAYVPPTAIPMLRNGEADITLTGTGGNAFDAATVFDKISVNGTDMSTIVHDDALQELIVTGASTMDPEIRANAYAQAQQIMFDKCYSVPIVNINGAYCYRTYIAEFVSMTAEKFNLYNFSFA